MTEVYGPMTVAELAAACSETFTQELGRVVLAAPRLRDGKRIPAPRMIDRALPVTYIGGKVHDWIVSVEVRDALAFVAKRDGGQTIPLRVIQPAEKMDASMRRMCGLANPPADPWAPRAEVTP